MKRILFICIFFVVQVDARGFCGIPEYRRGPRNVYYLTGVGDRLFAGYALGGNQDGWSEPYIALRDAYTSLGYRFHTSLPKQLDGNFKKNVFAIFCHNIHGGNWYQRFGQAINRMVILALEPPHVMAGNYNPGLTRHFKKILTWDDTRIDNERFIKYYFVQASLEMIDKVVPFKDKKLCALIGGNKRFGHRYELYSKRRQAIDFFERHASDAFDFYGSGWNPNAYTTYRGSVRSKTETFKNYKFSICYENISNQKGYVSEKIFGSLVAGCVPIYWGADNITDYVPQSCFIDKRKFPNFRDLYSFISNMKEQEYNSYLENIRVFLASEEADKYSIDSFVEKLMMVNAQLLGFLPE